MTKEEAIEVLKDLWRWEHPNWLEKDIREALDKGIEAIKENEKLKQELKEVKQELATFKALC